MGLKVEKGASAKFIRVEHADTCIKCGGRMYKRRIIVKGTPVNIYQCEICRFYFIENGF